MQFEAKVVDNMTPTLQRLLNKGHDFTPVMTRVEREIFAPLRLSSWGSSGLTSRSGELFKAVDTWHGKTSAGVTLRSDAGKDLILPKAATHTRGAKRGSFEANRAKGYRVKRYTTKGGRKVKAYLKKSYVVPWGNVPAREFFPTAAEIERQQGRIFNMIREHLSNV